MTIFKEKCILKALLSMLAVAAVLVFGFFQFKSTKYGNGAGLALLGIGAGIWLGESRYELDKRLEELRSQNAAENN